MQFKDQRVEEEWAGEGTILAPDGSGRPIVISSTLRLVLESFEAYTVAVSDWEPLITCLLRTPEENDQLYGGQGDHMDGVHVEGRAADIRTFDVAKDRVAEAVAWLNSRWVYDTLRPGMRVGLIEGCGPGSNAPHLHVQVSTRTIQIVPPPQDDPGVVKY